MDEPLKEYIRLVRGTAGRWLFIIPPALIYLAALFLALRTFLSMLRWNVDSRVVAAYITAIALSAVFALVMFSYARIAERSADALKRAGERFLLGAVALISALLVLWSMGQVIGLFVGRGVNIFLVLLLLAVNVLNLGFLLYAADSLGRGMRDLREVLLAEAGEDLAAPPPMEQ